MVPGRRQARLSQENSDFICYTDSGYELGWWLLSLCGMSEEGTIAVSISPGGASKAGPSRLGAGL